MPHFLKIVFKKQVCYRTNNGDLSIRVYSSIPASPATCKSVLGQDIELQAGPDLFLHYCKMKLINVTCSVEKLWMVSKLEKH